MPAVTDQLIMVPTGKIKPYGRNPRRNDLTVERLVQLIPNVGFNVPLVLDRDNVIVKGHARWEAAKRLKMRAVPCVYSDADEETIKLDRLADNRVQEFSDWDEEALARELGSLNLSFEFDLSSLNFDFQAAIEPLQSEPAPHGSAPFITSEDVAGTVPQAGADPDYLEVICHNCGNHLFVKP